MTSISSVSVKDFEQVNVSRLDTAYSKGKNHIYLTATNLVSMIMIKFLRNGMIICLGKTVWWNTKKLQFCFFTLKYILIYD